MASMALLRGRPQMMRAVQANRGMASSIQGLYMAELAKIAARKDDGVDEDLAAQMAAMKTKSQMEIDAAVKHADAAVLDLIKGMPSWVDADKVEAEYTKAKAKAPTPSFPSPYYPSAAAEATVTAANMKLLHAAYAKAS